MAQESTTPESVLEVCRAVDRAAMGQRTAPATRRAILAGAFRLLACRRVGLMVAPTSSDAAWSFHLLSQDGSVLDRSEIPSPTTLFGTSELSADGWTGQAWSLGSVWPSRDADAPVTAWPALLDGFLLAVLVVQWRDVAAAESNEGRANGRQLAEHAALALANVQRIEELESVGTGALRAVARMVDAGSPWTMGRSERVAAYAVEIGRRMGLTGHDLRLLETGGLVHDIGKLGLPLEILDKVGTLTTAERDLIRSHPDRGVQRLAAIPGFEPVLPMVRHHHELLDGSGYPLALKGDEIPLLVRILTVADVYDAMRSDRAYRSGLEIEAIVGVLTSGRGQRFDADAVDRILAMIDEDWQPFA